jgi:periplasmic protein TonB
MKHFLFLSILFHGVIFSILFSWKIPLVDHLLPRSVIEVSLIAMVEEKPKEVRVPPPPPKRKEVKPKPIEKKKEPAKEIEVKAPPPAPVAEAPAPEPERPAEKAKGGEEERPIQPLPEARISEGPGGPKIHRGGGGERDSGGAVMVASASQGIPLGGSPEEKKGEGRGLGEGPGEGKQISKAHGSSTGADEALLLILRKIEAAKKYPRNAQRRGIEGKAMVRFKINPNGSVEAVEILESSGSEVLDRASLQTVRDAAPLPYKEGWLKVGIVFKML